MKIVARTDIGKGRAENQDNYRAGRQSDDTVWAVVCDGMGGAAGGALASRLAVEQMEEVFCKGLRSDLSAEQVRSLMEQAAAQANDTVYRRAQDEWEVQGMGTTLVALVLKNGKAHLLHAGDSRAYLYHGGVLEQLTKDHSVVQHLVETGALTEREAAIHPKKNLITRALGVAPVLQCDYSIYSVSAGDILLLCSDGLTNSASEAELAAVLAGTDFFSAADEMIRLALSQDGQHNITALLVKAEQAED